LDEDSYYADPEADAGDQRRYDQEAEAHVASHTQYDRQEPTDCKQGDRQNQGCDESQQYQQPHRVDTRRPVGAGPKHQKCGDDNRDGGVAIVLVTRDCPNIQLEVLLAQDVSVEETQSHKLNVAQVTRHALRMDAQLRELQAVSVDMGLVLAALGKSHSPG
jgi:hypothetical protein